MNEEQFTFQRPPLDTQTFYNQFAASLHDFVLNEEDEDIPDLSDDVLEQRKPATPIEHSVKAAPKAIHELKTLIRERLQIRGDIESVSNHDQQELVSILMSELSAVWPEMRNQAPDPFLSNEENKELERKVTVMVVGTIERLYLEYIEKLKAANARKIFNRASNISRFKTQLSFDANKNLNILNIRRKLAAVLRHPPEDDDNLSEDSFVAKVRKKVTQPSKKARGSIVKKLQMTRQLAEQLYRETELDDLNKKMPVLNKEDLPEPRPASATTTRYSSTQNHQYTQAVESVPSEDAMTQVTSKSTVVKEIPCRLQKSNSLPLVDTGALFLEELEIEKKDINENRKSSINNIKISGNAENEKSERQENRFELDPRMDLQNLIRRNSPEKVHENGNVELEESMPPLLQAMPVHKKRSLNNGNEMQEENEMRCDTDSLVSTIATIDALNPCIYDQRTEDLPTQPSVVSKKLPNQAFVRTSDVRVSNRQNASHITLKRHQTIYNNFKGEIDDAMVKILDCNLFAGEEIKEVYEEVTKTINKVHLQFEKDTFVIKCPQTMEACDSFSSNFLQNTKTNKVLNQNIVGCMKPPWDTQGPDEWRNSPKFGGLGRQEILQLKTNACKELIMQENSFDKALQRKPAKSYAAWLAWWRSTINSEDYYKYISDKDNDFLSKAFHLYDSGDDDEDADLSQKTRSDNPEELAKKRVLEERQGLLQAQKEQYQNGYWNVNTVLLGGLGKSPVVEDSSPGDSIPVYDKADATTSSGKQFLSTFPATKSRPPSNLPREHAKASSTTLGIQVNEDLGSEYLQPPEITVQDRLERIWNRLRMPEKLRLDMAIKYSLDKNSASLAEAIRHWENAVNKITEREELIAILEKFERAASDPNRFFQKGPRGSSLSRLDESKSRDCLHKRLQQLDLSAKKAVHAIQSSFKDTVTYEGRPYLDKLSCDKIEMLYWLQQERRIASLDKDFRAVEVKGKISELPPISTLTLL